MAEYHAVLKRAISSLPDNSGAARRAVYQRARAALVNQLKSYDPPLSPSQVTAEQLQLEDAIRKVEAEAAREAFARPPEPGVGRASAGAGSAQRAGNGMPGASHEKGVGESLSSGLAGPASPVPPAAARGDGKGEGGLPPAGPGPDGHPPQQSARRSERGAPRAPAADLAGMESSLRADDPSRYGPVDGGPVDARPSRLPQVVLASVVGLVLVGAAALAYSQRDAIGDLFSGESRVASTGSGTDAAGTGTASDDGSSKKDTSRLLSGDDTEPVITDDTRSVQTTRIVTKTEPETSVAQDQLQPNTGPAPQVETIVPAEPEPEPPVVSEDTSTAVTDTQGALPPAAEPAESAGSETVAALGEPGADTSTPVGTSGGEVAVPPGSDGLVAQRSILYEEGAETGSSGVASKGDVVWSTGTDTSSAGTTHTALKATASIEDKGVQVDVSIRPNDDDALPASHLIEIRFELPDDFPGSGIANVPGLIMKTTEEARGDALIGASVKVAENYFWVALSSLDNERDRNLALLKDRGWIDIPVLYNNGKRAIITLEKGVPGDKAVETAFAAWQTN